MNKKMILESLEANMLEILNNELVENEPGSFNYEAAMDAFNRLLTYSIIIIELMDEEEGLPDDFNIFTDSSKMEEALREASKLTKDRFKDSEDTGTDPDGDS